MAVFGHLAGLWPSKGWICHKATCFMCDGGRVRRELGSVARDGGQFASEPGSVACDGGRLACQLRSVARDGGQVGCDPGSAARVNGRVGCEQSSVACDRGLAGNGSANLPVSDSLGRSLALPMHRLQACATIKSPPGKAGLRFGDIVPSAPIERRATSDERRATSDERRATIARTAQRRSLQPSSCLRGNA
jgi:hypothetical protein